MKESLRMLDELIDASYAYDRKFQELQGTKAAGESFFTFNLKNLKELIKLEAGLKE
jgi:hypothetical protein